MAEFIKLPDGVIRKDLIKKITKYDTDRYEGGTYFGIKIETEEEKYTYEEFGRNYYCGDNSVIKAEQKRDKLYDNIINQLFSQGINKNNMD